MQPRHGGNATQLLLSTTTKVVPRAVHDATETDDAEVLGRNAVRHPAELLRSERVEFENQALREIPRS